MFATGLPLFGSTCWSSRVELTLRPSSAIILPPLGQHEDSQLSIAICLLGKDVAGNDRIVAGLRSSPVPVADKLRHRHITPVVVVIADALEMLFFSRMFRSTET